MDLETFDNDASMDTAVERIMGKLAAPETAPEPRPRQNARAEAVQTETDPVVESEEGETEQVEESTEAKAGEEEEDFLEIPPDEEGKEATRIRAAEAVEAYKKMRQIDGDIANIVNEAEAKYTAEQDTILNELVHLHETVRTRAEAALRVIPAPQPPSKLYLDERSEYYDPTAYARLMIDYQEQAEAYQHLERQAQEARTYEEQMQAIIARQRGEREYARLARHEGFREWSDPAKREVHEAAMIADLDKHFGIKPEDLQGVSSHKLFILAKVALDAKANAAKAPEVRKQVKETAVKLTRGQSANQMRAADGTFSSAAKTAREELRSTGSSDAFANFLISSGALRK